MLTVSRRLLVAVMDRMTTADAFTCRRSAMPPLTAAAKDSACCASVAAAIDRPAMVSCAVITVGVWDGDGVRLGVGVPVGDPVDVLLVDARADVPALDVAAELAAVVACAAGWLLDGVCAAVLVLDGDGKPVPDGELERDVLGELVGELVEEGVAESVGDGVWLGVSEAEGDGVADTDGMPESVDVDVAVEVAVAVAVGTS